MNSSILYPFGVNLIGYPRGEMGLGEDVRHVGYALQSNGVPFCIVDVGLGRGFSQADYSSHEFISERPLYGINLFCQNGVETTKYLKKVGQGILKGRYSIGFWPWELPEWPESCHHAYDCVNEIWGISSYTTRSYGSFPGSVRMMGLPVSVEGTGKQQRRDFALPDSAYLYHFSFDLHSGVRRKNPLGLIRAFQKAFPSESSDEVGLVLKVNHHCSWNAEWLKVRWIAKRDPRIHLLEKPMRRPEVLALISACDCFVSLHRAEGFGRGIAEALLLGRQVIATGFSGNLDFCHEPRVALVRFKKVPLKRGEYFWGDGQQWAEPDLDHAVELIQEIRKNPRDISDQSMDFSAKKAGERYLERLKEIYNKQTIVSQSLSSY